MNSLTEVKIVGLALLGLLGTACPVQARLTAAQVGLVINDNDPYSQQVGAYYQQHRHIPTANVIHVQLPYVPSTPGGPNPWDQSVYNTYRSLTSAEFQYLQTQVNTLPSTVQALAIAWMNPSQVPYVLFPKAPPVPNSLTSALAIGLTASPPNGALTTCGDGTPSPYYNSTSIAPYTDFGMRISMMLAAYNVAQAETMIDKGIASDGTLPIGKAHILYTADTTRDMRARIFPPANLGNVLSHYITTIVDGSPSSFVNGISGTTDTIYLAHGASHPSMIANNTYVPGAVGDHATSFGGILPDGAGQTTLLDWIAAGETGSFGTVVEPCMLASKFPDPSIFIPYYSSGETLVEAYWKSVQQTYEGLFVGEPLAAPYAGGVGSGGPPPPPISSISVSLAPSAVTLIQNQNQSFTATVLNTANQGVTWILQPNIGTISASGLYTDLSLITTPQTVTVTAVSVANPAKSASAVITLNPTPPGVSIGLSPTTSALTANQTQFFTATVTGTANTAVTWSLTPALGTISGAGLYTAPAGIATQKTVTVRVTSVADPTQSATATITLNPLPTAIAVTLAPLTASLNPNQTQTFAATVSGTANTAVTWSLSPALGSISSTGLYTAPASILTPQTVTVRATSAADATKSAIATITLTPLPTSVAVTLAPLTASLNANQTQTFTATVTGTATTAVTWSLTPALGTITSNGLYTAPAAIATQTTVTVSATSVADPTKSAASTITLNPIPTHVAITVTPLSVALNPNQIQAFTATVTGTPTTAVTWALTPALGTVSTVGLYTAPASIATQQTVTLHVTSVADPTKSALSIITLNPATPVVTVMVAPLKASLNQNQTQPFIATVGGSANTGVAWSLTPNIGTISAAGLYTAPAVIASLQTVTIKAISAADTTKSSTATITLNPPGVSPVSITLSPQVMTLNQSQSQLFAATVTGTPTTSVTWTRSPAVGTLTSAGLYTAPTVISSTQSITITATSVADSTKFATAVVILAPPQAVAPPTAPPPTVWTAPQLEWASTVALNQTLSISYAPNLPVAQVEWDFAPSAQQGPSSTGLATGRLSSASTSFKTSGATLAPGQQHLSAGTYQVTVKLLDAQGAEQSQATQTVTLVESGLSAVHVYPNPWRINKHAGSPITFDGLTLGTTVKLFTVSGHEIQELHTDGPSVTWNLMTKQGDSVASGLYLYLIEDGQGEKIKGKFAVIK